MPTNHFQLDDGVLLAWIEGELSPDRHRLVTNALNEQPTLRARVDAMRLDRFTLSALGDEKAPADLLDGVADMLEREMLVGSSDALNDATTSDFDGFDDLPERIESTPMVVGTIRPARRVSDLQIAMAAGLLLIVGASAWFGGMMFGGRGMTPPDRNSGEFARNPDDAPRGVETVLADGTGSTPPIESLVGNDAPDSPSAVSRPGVGDSTLLASGEPITPERAVELLAAGRLVVRVRMADLTGLAWVDRLENRRSVRIDRDIPFELARALEPKATPVYEQTHEPPLLAMDGEAPGESKVDPPTDLEFDEPALPERVVASIVRIEVAADATTLSAVLRGLRTQTGIVSAQFEDAGEALPTQTERLDTDAILWWRLPPEQWTLRAKLPVVFEVLR